jgi:TonB family protein
MDSPNMSKKYALVLVIALSYCFGPLVARSQQSAAEIGRKLVRKVEPRYPDVARRMNLAGTVKVIAVVAPDGNVKKVEPLGGSPLLVQAAENAVSQWKYAPGSESRETIELHFNP